jgi:AraC-like DNA-binding protein
LYWIERERSEKGEDTQPSPLATVPRPTHYSPPLEYGARDEPIAISMLHECLDNVTRAAGAGVAKELSLQATGSLLGYAVGLMSPQVAPHGLPGSHVLHSLDLYKRWGVAEREVLRGSGLRREDLSDPDASIPIPTVISLAEHARVLTREPALGMYLGFQMAVSAHGFLGFAVMSAATLGEALELAVRYAPTRTTALRLHLEVAGHTAALVVDECTDLGSARDIILLTSLVGIWQTGNALLGREVTDSTVHVTFAEPGYYARFRHIAPRVRFSQPANRLVFDASLLHAPVVSADDTSLRLAREQCERLLGSIRSNSPFIERARRLVLRSGGGLRSLEELAASINVSSRTLRRRLALEGGSYSAVMDQERHARALILMRSSELSLKDVAKHLGYANVANFTRAFKRWTGKTPGAFLAEAP